jgi:hypothetical protein
MIAFNAMTQEQKNPTAEKKGRSPNPLRQDQEDDAGENHGNADTVEKLVPGRRVLVIVLRHVARQTWHKPELRLGTVAAEIHFIPKWGKWLGVKSAGKREFLRNGLEIFECAGFHLSAKTAGPGAPRGPYEEAASCRRY